MKKIGIIGLLLFMSAGCSRKMPDWYTPVPASRSPIVSISIRFDTGSARESDSRKGITRLTMMSVLENSTKQIPKEEIHRDLKDMAVSENIIVDTDVSTFIFRFHEDHFDTWLALLDNRFYHSLFDPEEIDRLLRQEKEMLENRILYRSEDLSRDVLVQMLYKTHPYCGNPSGYPYTLGNLTGEDLQTWWERSFSVNNMQVAVSGPLSRDQHFKLIDFLSGFHGQAHSSNLNLPDPQIPDTVHYVLIDNGSDVSAISLGWHLNFTRSHPAFYPFWAFSSWLGEHRTFYGHLMKELRVKRGFNYGDYAYGEHFVQNHYSVFPQPGHPRTFQYFSVWMRPLKNENVPFALRLVLHDLKSLQEKGIDSLAYEETKQFLKSYINLYARDQADYLGFLQDYAFYGLESFPGSAIELLDSTGFEKVQDIIRSSIDPQHMVVVVVGGDTDSLQKILSTGISAPPVYSTKPPTEILKRDQMIMEFPLPSGIIERYGTLDFLQKR